jgi:DNA-binding NarL/FixJ family response regulator
MRIALSAREKLYLDGLILLLTSNRCIVVAAATDVRSCLNELSGRPIDLLIVDSYGVSDDDWEFVRGAVSYAGFPVLAIGATDEPPSIFEHAVRRDAGAEALLAKVSSFPVTPYVAPRRKRDRTPAGGSALSGREMQMAIFIARGLSNRDIAVEMGIKEQSAKNLASVVMRRLQCENRTQVALLFMDQV